MNCAVMQASRVYYDNVLPAAKALIANSDVDKIILLIEDDEYPGYLPLKIETINAKNLKDKYFPKGCPNLRNPYVYLTLMRCALWDILPKIDRVLTLDADAFVINSIGSLPWTMDLGDAYVAGVAEPKLSTILHKYYISAGVMIMDLEKLRLANIGKRMLYLLNTKKMKWYEQDCINEACGNNLKILGNEWNSSQFTGIASKDKILIRHFAYERNWCETETFKYYKNLSWTDAGTHKIDYNKKE